MSDGDVEAATLRAYRRLLERAQATVASALGDAPASPDPPPLAPPPCP